MGNPWWKHENGYLKILILAIENEREQKGKIIGVWEGEPNREREGQKKRDTTKNLAREKKQNLYRKRKGIKSPVKRPRREIEMAGRKLEQAVGGIELWVEK